MAQPTKIIVGLGNPGPDYALTRHNIGFMAVDAIAADLAAGSWQRKFKGLCASASCGKHDVLLLKPMTFMNLSGESVGEAMRFYKLSPADVIVFHDDIDLLAGKAKVKQSGGHAGHNGLKSLDAHIGADYWRVRLGVGHPGDRAHVSDYVLGGFGKSDAAWLETLLGAVTKHFPLMLETGDALFMSRIAQDMKTAQ